MGRKKKQVVVHTDRMTALSTEEKLKVFEDFEQIFYHELSRIPNEELVTAIEGKAEDIAEKHYRDLGFKVYRSRVCGGYRAIGVEYYWSEYADKISEEDRGMIAELKTLLPINHFQELAYLVKEKSGTPDLLLVRDGKIAFVEVKYNYETVKAPTIYFWLKYGDRWPTKILRVVRKK